MFSKENYMSDRNFETKLIIFDEKFSSLDRKMDFYLVAISRPFAHGQITWY